MCIPAFRVAVVSLHDVVNTRAAPTDVKCTYG